MNKTKKLLWGIVLILIGVGFGLKAFGIIDFNLFFEGWWTLFIIVPCVIGLFTGKDITGNLIGLVIGGCLLLGVRDVVSFALLGKLVVPAIVIVVGLKLLLGAFRKEKSGVSREIIVDGGHKKTVCAVFSGQDMRFDGEEFDGAELVAVFGGIDCDLRGATITHDCEITVCAVFGGIDIKVPENVIVKSDTVSIFGGVSNKNDNRQGLPTLNITGACIFGGVDIL